MSYTSKLINQEALDSDTYNPPMDKKALMLQQLMESTAYVPRSKELLPPLVDPTTVDPVLQPHVETFNSLSPDNPYQGVISNPSSCIMDDVRDALNEVNPIMDEIVSLAPEIAQEWQDAGFDDDKAEIEDALDVCEEHTDRITSNLPSLAGVAQGAMALATVMQLLSNPCLGLDGFLGSIMDSGKKLLNDVKSQVLAMVDQAKEKLTELKNAITSGIQSAISSVKASISGMIGDLKDAMSIAKQKVTEFINKAKEEVMNFAKALLAQARQGLAELLANLPKDPCLRGLLGSIATGAAAAVLG